MQVEDKTDLEYQAGQDEADEGDGNQVLPVAHCFGRCEHVHPIAMK